MRWSPARRRTSPWQGLPGSLQLGRATTRHPSGRPCSPTRWASGHMSPRVRHSTTIPTSSTGQACRSSGKCRFGGRRPYGARHMHHKSSALINRIPDGTLVRVMRDTASTDLASLTAFNQRLVDGRAPKSSEPHSALEAVEAFAAEHGPDRVTDLMWDIARRIHAAEVADAHRALS